ncbi:MAG: hypothetical protein WBO54_03355, partial [Thermoanaerobaculia bacterium]
LRAHFEAGPIVKIAVAPMVFDGAIDNVESRAPDLRGLGELPPLHHTREDAQARHDYPFSAHLRMLHDDLLASLS